MAAYSTPEEVMALAVTDPEFQKIIDSTQPFTLSFDDINATRAQMTAMGAQMRQALNLPTENVQNIPVTMRDGFETEMLLVKPLKTPTNPSPLIVLVFGGGFVMGSRDAMLPSAQKFQDLFGATVVLVTYRLAPEHKFPTAAHDVWDCFAFAAKNAESFGASLKAGFIVGGISAGGNLAAVTARQAMAEGMPLTGAWLDIPALLEAESVPEGYEPVYLARQQNAKAPILNEKHAQFIRKAYEHDPKSPDFSPFGYSKPADMPPTFVQVCGQDPLRDDGLIFARVLQSAGVPTRLNVYPGVPHGFAGMYSTLPLAKQYEKDVVDGMTWLLKHSAQ